MKKNQKQSYIGWYVLTGLIIVFALFAPLIFTSKGRIDFTGTGQIGDTIAGTMGPFIAIAGVIVTFLAFLMQKNANDIISSQYENDKMSEKAKESELFKTRIKLMMSDLALAKADINTRIDKIDDFKQKLLDNPYRTLRLERAPSDLYRRMSESDREDLLLALIGTSVQDPTLALNNYYSISDYMSPAIDLINNMCDGLSNEIHDKLIIIRESLISIQDIALSHGWLGYNQKKYVLDFCQALQDNKQTGESGESSFLNYWKAIDKLRIALDSDISKSENAESFFSLKKSIELCDKALEQYQRILNAASQINNTLERSIDDFRATAERCDLAQQLITNPE